jgi:diketogulonate reductase-like aldo/keto reductase
MNDSIANDGVRIPRFLYGTAWKEDDTERLTLLALRQGFRGIDTANQRKHYHEAAVGHAVSAVLNEGAIARDDLFLQTKFTFRDGQDHRLPYDPAASIAEQVEQSFASSLSHLGVETLDSYLLHGPSTRAGLAREDWDAWRAMEAIHASGRARMLGISNVTAEQLRILFAGARIKPRFVQNRCYASRGWDCDVRSFCTANGIVYQGFSLLTANQAVLAHPVLACIAARHGCGPGPLVFRFALAIGMIALTGTTSAEHMRADLDVFAFELEPDEITAIEEILSPR